MCTGKHPLKRAKVFKVNFVLDSLRSLNVPVCNLQTLLKGTERCMLQKGPGVSFSFASIVRDMLNCLHTYWANKADSDWILSHVRTAAPGNDLGFLGTAGQNSLCLTHSLPILFTSFLHLTSCLGPCMLTAAQVTGPQTLYFSRRGRERGL